MAVDQSVLTRMCRDILPRLEGCKIELLRHKTWSVLKTRNAGTPLGLLGGLLCDFVALDWESRPEGVAAGLISCADGVLVVGCDHVPPAKAVKGQRQA